MTRFQYSHETDRDGLLQLQSPSDITLIQRVTAGDEIAFNEIVDRYQKRVFLTVKRMLHDDDDATDATQEAFISLYHSLKKFRCDSSIYTYVYRIAVNVATDYLRKRKVRASASADELLIHQLSGGREPQRYAEQEELKRLVADAVVALPVQQKRVFVLRFYEELSYEEIGTILNRSIGRMRTDYCRAIKSIGKYVKGAMMPL